MALTIEEKSNLDKLLGDLYNRTDPKVQDLNYFLNVIDLTGISIEDLKSLTDPKYTIGVDFRTIDTSGKFTTEDMNKIAPGSIDVDLLKQKILNKSIVQAEVVDVVDTQSGLMAVKNQLKMNVDVEDLMDSKTNSQGIVLKVINDSRFINEQEVDSKTIKSNYI